MNQAPFLYNLPLRNRDVCAFCIVAFLFRLIRVRCWSGVLAAPLHQYFSGILLDLESAWGKVFGEMMKGGQQEGVLFLPKCKKLDKFIVNWRQFALSMWLCWHVWFWRELSVPKLQVLGDWVSNDICLYWERGLSAREGWVYSRPKPGPAAVSSFTRLDAPCRLRVQVNTNDDVIWIESRE